MILDQEKKTLISIFDRMTVQELPEAIALLKKRHNQRLKIMKKIAESSAAAIKSK